MLENCRLVIGLLVVAADELMLVVHLQVRAWVTERTMPRFRRIFMLLGVAAGGMVRLLVLRIRSVAALVRAVPTSTVFLVLMAADLVADWLLVLVRLAAGRRAKWQVRSHHAVVFRFHVLFLLALLAQADGNRLSSGFNFLAVVAFRITRRDGGKASAGLNNASEAIAVKTSRLRMLGHRIQQERQHGREGYGCENAAAHQSLIPE